MRVNHLESRKDGAAIVLVATEVPMCVYVYQCVYVCVDVQFVVCNTQGN